MSATGAGCCSVRASPEVTTVPWRRRSRFAAPPEKPLEQVIPALVCSGVFSTILNTSLAEARASCSDRFPVTTARNGAKLKLTCGRNKSCRATPQPGFVLLHKLKPTTALVAVTVVPRPAHHAFTSGAAGDGLALHWLEPIGAPLGSVSPIEPHEVPMVGCRSVIVVRTLLKI